MERSDLGIDLHSAAVQRINLPQILVSPSKPETMELAQAFDAPLILTSKVRPGSLRQTGQQYGVGILLYEADEGLRFDEFAVRAGVTSILRVMRRKGMISGKSTKQAKAPSILSTSSTWLRVPASGLLRTFRTIGDEVDKGDVLGMIAYPFGEVETKIVTEVAGLIIGRTNLLQGRRDEEIAGPGTAVYLGNQVFSGSDSAVIVTFVDGTILSLDADSAFTIAEYACDTTGQNSRADFFLDGGQLGFVSGEIAKTGDMTTSSTESFIEVRGTARFTTLAVGVFKSADGLLQVTVARVNARGQSPGHDPYDRSQRIHRNAAGAHLRRRTVDPDPVGRQPDGDGQPRRNDHHVHADAPGGQQHPRQYPWALSRSTGTNFAAIEDLLDLVAQPVARPSDHAHRSKV